MEGADEQLMVQPRLSRSSPGWKGCVYPELVLMVFPLLSVQIPSWNSTPGRCHWLRLAAPWLPTCRVLCFRIKTFPGRGSAHTRDFPGAGDAAPGVGGGGFV